MCVCIDGDRDSPFPLLGNGGNNSVPLGFINETIWINSRAKKVINWEFRILIGDGHNTDFSKDD